jgi:hypothetical protein
MSAPTGPRLWAAANTASFRKEFKPRDSGPDLNIIPEFDDMQNCPVVCLNNIINNDAISPAPDCNDYDCTCRNIPTVDAYLSLCIHQECSTDTTDLPTAISVFSVYCNPSALISPASSSTS